jgi:hypothetical protein
MLTERAPRDHVACDTGREPGAAEGDFEDLLRLKVRKDDKRGGLRIPGSGLLDRIAGHAVVGMLSTVEIDYRVEQGVPRVKVVATVQADHAAAGALYERDRLSARQHGARVAQILPMAFQPGDRRERALQLLRRDLSKGVVPGGKTDAGVFVANDLDNEVRKPGRADRGNAICPVQDDEALVGAGGGDDRRVAQKSRLAQASGEGLGPPLVLLLVGDKKVHRDKAKIGKAETGRIRVGHGVA